MCLQTYTDCTHLHSIFTLESVYIISNMLMKESKSYLFNDFTIDDTERILARSNSISTQQVI